jgi:hypothetical protein
LTSCLEHFFQKIGLIGSGSVQNTGR